MKNMKISKKLILSFLIITAFSIALACVGIFSTASVNSNYVYLLSEPVERRAYLLEMQTDFMTMRYRSANYVMNSGDAEFINGTLVPQYQGAYTDFRENLAAYIQSNNNDNRRDPAILKSNNEKAAKLDELIEQYRLASENTLKLALAGNAKSADQALKDVIPITNEIGTLMEELIVPTGTFVHESISDMERYADAMLVVQITVTVFCLAVAIVCARYISNMISRPLGMMNKFLNRFGTAGDLEMTDGDRVSYENRNQDEIGHCQEALYLVINRLNSISEALGKVAAGDLTADLKRLSEKDSMGIAVEKMVESLNAMFGEIHTASGQVNAASEQISQSAQGLASGSSQQAASIQEFSATLTEVHEKTDRNAENSTKARAASEQASSQLMDSMRSMDEMLEAMKSIDESSGSITKVIKVIDDIAFQTNILALNAAVEAARAGQHGKGFAVVADEVRNLASKSAAAAKETAALIEGSSERVHEGSQIVTRTNASLEAVAEYARELARLVDNVATASTEQSRAIKEINQGVEQISTVVQANSATAEESAAAAQEMSAQATMLDEIVARFRLKQANPQRGGLPNVAETAGLRVYSSGRKGDMAGFALAQLHEKF